MAINEDFLGTGWAFPPTFTKPECSVKMVSDEEDIHESLTILLSTALGERVMEPTYGCNMQKLLFEPMSTTFFTYVEDLIKNAILFNEPRIDLNDIEIISSGQLEGVLEVHLTYTIRATNSRYNYVYPFYLTEAESTI